MADALPAGKLPDVGYILVWNIICMCCYHHREEGILFIVGTIIRVILYGCMGVRGFFYSCLGIDFK